MPRILVVTILRTPIDVAFDLARSIDLHAQGQAQQRERAIAGRMRGALLQEEYTSSQGDEVVRTLTYDRFNKRYRMTQIDGRQTQMDVREGEFGEDGILVVSNLESGTTQESFGNTVHGRLSIKDVSSDGFTIEQEFSIDGGESWFVSVKSAYTRSAD